MWAEYRLFMVGSLLTICCSGIIGGEPSSKDASMSPFLGEKQANAFLTLDQDANDGDSATGGYRRNQRRYEFWGKRSDTVGDQSDDPIMLPVSADMGASGDSKKNSEADKRARYDFIGKRGTGNYDTDKRRYDFIGRRGFGNDDSDKRARYDFIGKRGHDIYQTDKRARYDFIGKRGSVNNIAEKRRYDFIGKRGSQNDGLDKRPRYDFIGKRAVQSYGADKRARYDFIGKRGSMLFVQRSYDLKHGRRENPLSLLRQALYASPSGDVHNVDSRARHDFVGKRGVPDLSPAAPPLADSPSSASAATDRSRWHSAFHPYDIRPDSISKLSNALERISALSEYAGDAQLKRDPERSDDGKRKFWQFHRPSHGLMSRLRPNFRFAVPMPHVLQRMYLSRASNGRAKSALI